MTSTSEDFAASWEGVDVDASSVERALARLIQEMNPPSQEGELHPPARASVLNLIVRAPKSEDEARAVEALGELAELHPSRTLVVGMDPAAEPGLDALVSAHCTLRTGSQARVCFEEIRLTARGAVASSLGSVVAPLLIPDLPAILWWLGDHPGPEEDLLLLCDRLIVDSASLGVAGLVRLEELVGSLQGQIVVSDLAWSALKPWRELLAQLFDPTETRPYQRNLSSVRLHYVADGPVAQPLLLLGWLAVCLGWTPRVPIEPAEEGGRLHLHGAHGLLEISLHPVPPPGNRYEPGALLAVTLVARRDSQEATFAVEREDNEECAAVRTVLPDRPITSRTMPLSRPSLAAMLSRELEQMARDPLYQESLAWAGRIARVWNPNS